MRVGYTEIVTPNVDRLCQLLEASRGLMFGEAISALGGARVAQVDDETRIGVRAPLAEHEVPIVRPYFEVPDIAAAAHEAEEAGALIAYPPTVQGDTGTWAIYILDDLQIGLWQPPTEKAEWSR